MDITVSNINKKYKKQLVLKDVSLYAKSGEIVGILGRNGCGKTTLISIIAGVEKADSGRVIFSERGRELVGYVPQVNPLIEEASVIDNLGLWIKDSSKTDEILTAFDFDTLRSKKVYKLSGGMKRRVSIMCALSNSPRLLIMDEPTASLDIEYKKLIHGMMEEYVKSGGTIILVTHELEEINMCDRCYSLHEGHLSEGRIGQ